MKFKLIFSLLYIKTQFQEPKMFVKKQSETYIVRSLSIADSDDRFKCVNRMFDNHLPVICDLVSMPQNAFARRKHIVLRFGKIRAFTVSYVPRQKLCLLCQQRRGALNTTRHSLCKNRLQSGYTFDGVYGEKMIRPIEIELYDHLLSVCVCVSNNHNLQTTHISHSYFNFGVARLIYVITSNRVSPMACG